MNKIKVALLAIVLVSGASDARASSESNPGASYGAVTLGVAIATKIPTAPMTSRDSVTVWNLDAARIWCGFDSSVTAATGVPVEPNGGSVSFPVSVNAARTGIFLWCFSAAGQTAPLNTRYAELR